MKAILRQRRLHISSLSFEVWCNASIRVLGTRGDSSTLSSLTKHTSPINPQPKARVTLIRATRGSDVAGNMRVFQIPTCRDSNLSFRSNLRASPSG